MIRISVQLSSGTTRFRVAIQAESIEQALEIAARAGMTLSDYLLSEIEQIAEKPSLHEWLEKVSRDEPVEVEEPPEAIIRRMRDADDPRDLG